MIHNSPTLQVSLAARQLINVLLNRDPGNRLGSNTGANEIKQHPFFRGINWPLIRSMVIYIMYIYYLHQRLQNQHINKYHLLS